ncbi:MULTISPECIES: phage tail tape measure protein [unclassified Rathayibacter]|uniref:phage tail tape measure protein n=1 Tax=unclassified Rathayibacter TaxID=2609250 RepID=UPI0014048F17|nr:MULTISPECIES: phage tail tape measure protein [unclassified Rathayibacter]
MGQYIDGMKKAAKATTDSSKDAEAALERQRQAMTDVGGQAAIMGGVVLAGVGVAIAKFVEFDKSMSEVQASTHESASGMADLRDAALEAGASTVFSATEAANAIDELAKAGVSTADITGGALSGALDLASAGGLAVADAAATAATAMTIFNKTGAEVPHIADLLAAGAGKAQGSVDDLSQALNQGGLVASQAGFSIEETTGTLAAFASAGLLGSDAGTSLKTAILAMQNPTDKSKGLMEKYGISVYDAQGKMRGMTEIAGQLEQAFIGKTDAERDSTLATIFGSDAVRAASVLYTQGADGIQEWIDKTDDSGYAAITAATKLDNLAGDVEYLQGAIDTGLIQAGSGANEVLREMVQRATDVADGIGQIPAPVLSTGLALAGTVGGFALLGGSLLVGAVRVGEMRRNLVTLNKEMPRTAKFAAGAAKGLGAIAAVTTAATVLSAIATAGFEGAAGLEETAKAAKSLEGLNTLFSDLDGASEVRDLGSALDVVLGDDMNSNINRFVSSVNQAFGGPIQDGVQATRDQFEGLDSNLRALVEGGAADTAAEQFDRIAQAAIDQGYSVEQVKDMFPQYADALIGAEESSGGLATTTETLSAGIEQVATMSEEAQKALDDWREEVVKADGSFFSITGAVDDLITKQKEYATSTADATEDAGDSWEDYYDGVSFNLDEYLAGLQEQIDAQTNWEANLVSLSGRVSKSTLDYLIGLGEEGAPIVAALFAGTDEQIASFESKLSQGGVDGGYAIAGALENSAPVIAAAGEQLGQQTADEISRKLAEGTSTVQEIIDEYGLIVESKNPSIQVDTSNAERKIRELQSAVDSVSGSGGYSSTGLPSYAYADGGTIFGPGTASSDTAGLFALSVGEEVVSNKRGQATEHRSLLKAVNAGASTQDLYDMIAGSYADGGTVGDGDIYDPRAYSAAYASERPAYVPGADGWRGGGSSTVTTTNMTTVVNPQPRQSEREIGQAAADWQTARLRGLV